MWFERTHQTEAIKIGIWQYSLKTTTDQSSYQIPIICDLFGLCNSTNISSRNSPPWNLSSSFVTCTVRDICGANTLFSCCSNFVLSVRGIKGSLQSNHLSYLKRIFRGHIAMDKKETVQYYLTNVSFINDFAFILFISILLNMILPLSFCHFEETQEARWLGPRRSV